MLNPAASRKVAILTAAWARDEMPEQIRATRNNQTLSGADPTWRRQDYWDEQGLGWDGVWGKGCPQDHFVTTNSFLLR